MGIANSISSAGINEEDIKKESFPDASTNDLQDIAKSSPLTYHWGIGNES